MRRIIGLLVVMVVCIVPVGCKDTASTGTRMAIASRDEMAESTLPNGAISTDVRTPVKASSKPSESELKSIAQFEEDLRNGFRVGDILPLPDSGPIVTRFRWTVAAVVFNDGSVKQHLFYRLDYTAPPGRRPDTFNYRINLGSMSRERSAPVRQDGGIGEVTTNGGDFALDYGVTPLNIQRVTFEITRIER